MYKIFHEILEIGVQSYTEKLILPKEWLKKFVN